MMAGGVLNLKSKPLTKTATSVKFLSEMSKYAKYGAHKQRKVSSDVWCSVWGCGHLVMRLEYIGIAG